MKNININILKDYLFFGLDMLEFTLHNVKKDSFFHHYWGIIWNLDADNSNRAYILIDNFKFSYQKIYAKWYDYWLQFSTVIDGEIIDCFCLLLWKNIFNSEKKSKDKVVFYSSFFVLEYTNKLPWTLEEFFEYFFHPKAKLYRMDAALDLPYTIKQINNSFFAWIRFFSQIWEDKKHPEFSQTYYIKNPQSSQNRSYIIRIYDKILDTFKKQKHFLYPHLKNADDVRRIELELRPRECERLEKYKISEILWNNNKIIQKIFAEYFNKNLEFKNYELDFEKLELKKYVNKKFNLKETFLKFWHIPESYIKQIYWYVKKIKTVTGFNWLFQLILNIKYKEDKEIKESIKIQVKNILLWQNVIQNFKWNIKEFDIWYSLDFLDNYIKYIKKLWIYETHINKILKKNISQKPRIILNK